MPKVRNPIPKRRLPACARAESTAAASESIKILKTTRRNLDVGLPLLALDTGKPKQSRTAFASRVLDDAIRPTLRKHNLTPA